MEMMRLGRFRMDYRGRNTLSRDLDAVAYTDCLAIPCAFATFFTEAGVGVVLEVRHDCEVL